MTTPAASETITLTVKQGATFRTVFAYTEPDPASPDPANPTYVPVSISDLRARLQVRQDYTSPTALLSLVDERITAGGGLTVEPVIDGVVKTGEVHVRISALLTAAVTALDGVFDLELYDPTDPTEVDRLVQGVVIFDPEVTK